LEAQLPQQEIVTKSSDSLEPVSPHQAQKHRNQRRSLEAVV